MSKKLSNNLYNKNFQDLWSEAKKEIFRLELLNTYLVDYEMQAFNKYKNGLEVTGLEIPGFDKWLQDIEQKTKNGVKILDIQVLDLPMSDYLKFGISCASFLAEEKGEKFMFIERKDVLELINGIDDFWLFDSEIVLPMNYDKDGRLISMGIPTTNSIIVSKCRHIRDILIKNATFMHEFLKENNIDIKKYILKDNK